jgi:hypothetical protein
VREERKVDVEQIPGEKVKGEGEEKELALPTKGGKKGEKER